MLCCQRLHKAQKVFHSSIATKHIFRFSTTTYSDPYTNLYQKDGYKQIKELEKFKKLINDISNIEEAELFHPHNAILDSTEYFNSNFGQFHQETLNMDAVTSSLSMSGYLLLYDAAITTHCIHVQSRLAAFEGKGFYTIGPCGEEALSTIGLVLNLDDSVALHYRHLSANIARNLKRAQYDGTQLFNPSYNTLSQIIKDRARGYVVSTKDPISSGGHCLLGSSDFDYDYLVTSTLASQSGPAVGRAFGNILSNTLKLPNPKFKSGSLSFVSVGDGSVNNSHFLSAINIVDYALHHNVKVPLLIGISNNKICISLKDKSGWLYSFCNKLLNFRKYKCDANNLFDVYHTFKCSAEYVRKTQKPAIVIFDEVKRQFGHAATDRQNAYLSPSEIEAAANNDLMLKMSKQFIKLGIFENKMQCLDRLLFISSMVQKQFESVYNEPKLDNNSSNRQIVKNRNSAPLVAYKMMINNDEIKQKLNKVISDNGIREKSVMRKCMIYAIEEILNIYPHSVYIGEDVSHGGYYLVTDGLSDKYPLRIRDFPPDETALFGIGIGYSQSGLLPIVEMPYAKYLDCGADMFFEAIIMNWLSNGKQPNGVLFRLQGFGNGLFGGNFHTHNSLYIPPGLDVVCYSNGYDYINGWRYCIQQAQNGRTVMSVDCTQLLNNRHVYGEDSKDQLLMNNIPHYNEYLTFDDVIIYNNEQTKFILYDSLNSHSERMVDAKSGYFDILGFKSFDALFGSKKKKNEGMNLLIIGYGLGINASRQAQKELMSQNEDICNVLVVDVPYLSDIPNQLKILLNAKDNKQQIDCILFSDMCKEGQNPLNGMIAKLQQQNILQNYEWISVAAQYTYNPLGKDLTFLSKADVMEAADQLIENYKKSKMLKREI